MFHHGNLRDYLLKLLSHLLHLIIVLLTRVVNESTKTRVKFTGSCLQQPKVSYAHGKVVNIYSVYELGASGSHIDNPTL